MPHAVSLTSAPTSTAIDEIRSLSRPFAALFGFLFFAMLLICICLTAAALLYGGPSLRMPPDHTSLLIMPDLTEHVLGGLLYVIGRVMDLGREIELERSSFV